MASVVIRRNFAPLTQVELITAADMRAVGEQARQLILARTARGVDASGQAFAPYSAGYADQRAKAGLPTAPVRLSVSGEMLNALTITKVTDRSVTLGWAR